MNSQIKSVFKAIKKHLKKADYYASKASDLKYNISFYNFEEPYLTFKEDEFESLESNLDYELRNAELYIVSVIDMLKLKSLRKEFSRDFEDEKKTTTIGYFSYGDFFYSPKYHLVKDYFEILQILTFEKEIKIKRSDGLRYVERILRGTPKLINDLQIDPRKESDVQKAVYNHFTLTFPDTVREMKIPKIAKVFKPDIGVKSLRCAIEYKFVATEKEAKKFIGEIFEDVGGYEGDKNWKIFYAVIYMTKAFLTQDQVEAEFKIAKIPEKWKPIVVYGYGGRTKRETTKEELSVTLDKK